jgi:gentisate 1,2-dioxygenase
MISSRTTGFREPTPDYGPFLWKWDEIEAILAAAVDHVPPEEAHRRFIGFQHPDVAMGTTPNLVLGGQMILPSETAPCHRHTMDAIRFVVDGDGSAGTVVDGENFPMARGDLVTTPNWSWHDHVNGGDTATTWLDGAVAPLIVHFQIGFGEPHQQPAQDIIRPEGFSARRFSKMDNAAPVTGEAAGRAPYRYPWTETEAALMEAGQGPADDCDGAMLRYAHPETGGATLPTMDCRIQMLNGRQKLRPHRHTHAAIYHVFEGEGSTTIGEERFDWVAGDTFVVPLWAWHAHENGSAERAILFSITDEPVMRSLGFYREETAP